MNLGWRGVMWRGITCGDSQIIRISTFDGNQVMTDRWLSAEGIAKRLGASKDAVHAWINEQRQEN